jgi:hypothetical protein
VPLPTPLRENSKIVATFLRILAAPVKFFTEIRNMANHLFGKIV